jgi:Fe-S cluster assembly ATP-binding protein
MEPEVRSHMGLFLSFQSPVEIPGVSNVDFLRIATNSRRKAAGQSELDPLEFYAFVMPKLEALNMDAAFLNRNVNEGFSGGEKKRNEILQLACLEADAAILDEIDSGLDIDALRDVSAAVNGLKKDRKEMGVLMVTHYKRLLDYIKPDYVHVMQDGAIITTGDMTLVDKLELEGYQTLSA